MNVFLSASVPLPNRNIDFFNTADVIAIRDSIKSLVLEVARYGQITFGGHPAITPLVALVIKQLMPNRSGSFILYQSEYFFRYFPRENDEFIDVRVTEAVHENRAASLSLMRERMLTHCQFDAAFFIGGMEGVVEEYDLLRSYQPNVPLYPIASTGGASLELWQRSAGRDLDLLNELTYPTLFRKLLRRAD